MNSNKEKPSSFSLVRVVIGVLISVIIIWIILIIFIGVGCSHGC